MYEILNTFAAAPTVQQVTIEKGSWAGNFGAAGVGVLLFIGSRAMAKNKMLLWGPKFGGWVDTKLGDKKFDWKSLMSFVFGFAGITALLGATGQIGSFVRWLQSMFTWLGGFSIFNELGMGVICAACVFMAMKKREDSIKDITWGGLCALAFPLGGGVFLEMSMKMANILVNALNGMPSA